MHKRIMKLNEDNRQKLLSKSKSADSYNFLNRGKGKNRYERRVHSKFSSSVKSYNEIDMNKLFKEGILDVAINIVGETDNYQVLIKFAGFIQELRKLIADNNDDLNLRIVIKALIAAFNRQDVYIHCNCPDFFYRLSYWATKNSIDSGPPETRPSDITNPRDTKGSGCKHILLVLANNTWLVKVSSVINNYIHYMEQHYPKLYADVIYPALYDKKYDDNVQLDIETSTDSTTLDSNPDILDYSNEEGATRGQFKKGNKQGIRFAPQNTQISKQFDFDSLITDSDK